MSLSVAFRRASLGRHDQHVFTALEGVVRDGDNTGGNLHQLQHFAVRKGLFADDQTAVRQNEAFRREVQEGFPLNAL